jgi:histidine ammonia-lyase
MISQYTAAALVSENKVLIHPASGDSIPTSANQEDHVSMGTISARHAARILDNVEHIVAIELLCAAQGIDFRRATCGKGTASVHATLRANVPSHQEDRALTADIEALVRMIRSGEIFKSIPS